MVTTELRVEDLPLAAALELDGMGTPVRPFAAVDLRRPTTVRQEAVRAAAATSRVLVGVAPDGLAPELLPLAQQLSVTLVHGPADLPQTVAVPDVGEALEHLESSVLAHPRAATTLTDLLRLTSALPVEEGLVVESMAYSVLLAGSEFRAWRQAHPPREARPGDDPAVLLHRDHDELEIVLNRPGRHNAYSREVRDALVEALDLACLDESIDQVVLRGNGPSFCSGGDLAEFGATSDVSLAHHVRLRQSAVARLHTLGTKTVARLHGACVGAGIEIPAIAGRVVAAADTWFQLPELAMGLVPGAGGTVSVPRRIGRWRTAHLVLSGQRLDVRTAHDWGLVDQVLS
jgi:hypothetical protein